MLGGLLGWIALAWIFIHGVHAFLSTSTSSMPSSSVAAASSYLAPQPSSGSKSSTSSAYRAWLDKRGIRISFLSITFTSNRIAKYFYRIALWSPTAWRLWFSFGVFVGCALLALGPLLVLFNLTVTAADLLPSFSMPATSPSLPGHEHQHHQHGAGLPMTESSGSSSAGVAGTTSTHAPRIRQFEMRPLIPGVNVPAEHTLIFFVVVLLNSLFHEAGHGIAAALHDVYIENCGMFIQVVLPGAFVELHSPQLNAVKAFQQLRIFCAGVWHNIVLALLAFAVYLALPTLLSSSYMYGHGVAVAALDVHSPLAASLQPGDVITAINEGCEVNTIEDIHRCFGDIEALRVTGRTGMCLSRSLVDAYPPLKPPPGVDPHAEVHADCCVEDTGDTSQSRLCFAQRAEGLFKCIPARKAADSAAVDRCVAHSHCSDGFACWNVTLEVDDMHFVRFHVAGKEPVLFLGPLNEFSQSVLLSDYVPLGVSSLRFPLAVRTFLGYMIALSPALAVLNALPCWLLDGAHMLKAVFELLLPSPRFDEERVAALRRWCLHINSALLVLLIALSFWRLAASSPPTALPSTAPHAASATASAGT
ncbi:hypothetical protein PTSG_09454 [Salpingoeca rosetta]|uniref:Endopeptidase S2P n=1 Tax=Salpingoeca rosetta (strain ATCC 50818 / BSB-021) TaxID=946362 RepID=F2UMN6_SALR5|nr:uncharacterized protein PTSG_09454 [Salpingoeca rosetta]EGD78385.1 hypothetical protein PTSG_09454 [Salpingoeca rosetta]|eukprot:XP_004989708.1 hypothetical protein PTSG_09454 [Salpingoeca rosetta]